MGFVNFRFLWLLVTVVVVLVLQLIGTSYPWYGYYYDFPQVDNYTAGSVTATCYLSYQVEFYSNHDSPVTCDWTTTTCNGMESVKNLWRGILASAVIAIILTGVELLVLVTWTFDYCSRLKFRSKLRIPLMCVAVLATAATFAAWLMLFAHGKALSDEYRSHVKFAGDHSGPLAGWCLFVASSAISLHAAVVLAMSGSPDSEAKRQAMRDDHHHLLVNVA